MQKFAKFGVTAVAVAFAFAFAATASAVSATAIYTPASGYLMVGSGMGAKAYQAPNVIAAQTALNACVPGTALVLDGKYGPLTKAKFQAFQAMKNIAQDGIIGPITAAQLAACSGDQQTPGNQTPGNTGDLEGGAGDADVTKTTTDVEDTLKEGENDVPVLGFEVKADGSDIKITSVKVAFQNDGYASSSERLDRYVDEVTVWMGDEQVGSADAEDFDRETGSPDVYDATIQLDGAIVDEDDEVKFYVAVSAASTVDSDDITNGDWNVILDTVRFNDATGAILTASLPSTLDTTGENFTFDQAGADDQLDVKSWSENPDDMTVKVDENTSSDEILALAFKLDVDEDSSDLTIFDLPISIEVADYGSDASDIDDIIDSVTVEVGGDSFDADLVGSGTLSTDPDTFVYGLDLNDGELVIDAGDVVEAKVFIKFNDQDGNYDLNTTVQASINADDIDAEGEDELGSSDLNGAQTGALLTLNTAVASVSSVDWSVASAGSIIDFLFTVEAEDEDVDVLVADIIDSTSGTASITNTSGTPETDSYGVLSKISGDASSISGGFRVSQGDTARFRVRYAVGGSNGDYANVTITNVVGQEIADDDQVSPTAVLNLQ